MSINLNALIYLVPIRKTTKSQGVMNQDGANLLQQPKWAVVSLFVFKAPRLPEMREMCIIPFKTLHLHSNLNRFVLGIVQVLHYIHF